MKKYAVAIHPQAERDIDRAKDREARRDPSWPDAIDDALQAASLLLARFPELGAPLQIRGVWSMIVRTWQVGASGYVLRYKVEHDRERIVVLRFRHEAQRPLKR